MLVLAMGLMLVGGCAGTKASTKPAAAGQGAKSKKTRPADRPKKKKTRALDRATPAPTSTTGALAHGPVVGAVTPNSARVFVRTDRAAQVAVRYGTHADLSDAVTTAPLTTDEGHDFAAQVTLAELQPGTAYFVDVSVNDRPQLTAPYPTFRTFPPAGAPSAFKFVILNDFFWKPSPTFRNATRENAAFVVIGGDFSHSNPGTLTEKRALFKERYDPTNPRGADFVNLILRRFAVAHFWDDHDYGVNNGDKTYPNKALSLQALQEFFPTYPLGADGDWQQFSYGDAAFFLLDSRSQRDPDSTPDSATKSMLDGDHLGAQSQWAWLTQGLQNSTATWKFIFTPVVFNPTVPKDDAWNGFQTERTRLVQFIRDHNIGGVILLSGDLHAGAIDDGTHSDFPEMLVPPPNGTHCLTAPKPGDWSVGVYAAPPDEPCIGYGVVSVETEPPRVTLQVKNSTGDTVLQTLVSHTNGSK
jgi:alkaline phosphatase D